MQRNTPVGTRRGLRTGAVWVFVVAAAVGCSRQDFSRPTGYVSRVFDSGKPYAPNKPPTASERSEKLGRLLSSQATQVGGSADYLLGPGDEVDIAIFALESPDQTSHLPRTISREGAIALPWVGELKVAGSSVRQCEQIVSGAYSNRFIKNPQVTVQITQYRSVAVLMTGAVKNPGIYYLTDNKTTLLEMLAKSGGLSDDASDELILLRGEKTTFVTNFATAANGEAIDPQLATGLLAKGRDIIPINLKSLIDNGDVALNLEVTSGDVISVRPMAQQYIYVLGYVGRPGAFEMRSQQIDALKAVALAGGLGPTARAENSFLIRETPTGEQIIPIDLTKIAQGVRPPVMMETGDTLVVGSGFFARLSEFVRPSLSAGASYSPVP